MLFRSICPAGTLEAAVPILYFNSTLRDVIGALFYWKAFLLVLLIVSSIFIFRPFCRFICPLGAFYSILNKYSYYGIRIDNKKCTNCQICTINCKMDCQKVGDRECIQCGDCLKKCPEQALSFGKK